MKKIFTLFFISLTAVGFAQQTQQRTSAAFTPGNLVVYRVGDGSAALTSASTAVFLDEYNKTTANQATTVQTIALPTVTAGANKPITAAATSTTEGYITLSPNGQYLWVGGYDATTGVASVSSAAGVNRVVGRVDAAGTVNSSTYFTETGMGNIRGATGANNGTDIWAATSSGGVRYLTLGSTTTSTQVSSSPTNIRTVAIYPIYNNQLYISAASGTTQGVAQVGSGLPTTSGQTTTLLNGFPTASGPSPEAFSMNAAGNIVYLADDRTNGSGGIQKWTLSGGTWTLQYTMAPSLTLGVRGLTVDWNTGGAPVIYATTGTTSTTPNALVKVVDPGTGTGTITPTFTTLATAPANTAFRGVAFTPGTVLPLSLLSFNGGLNNSKVSLDWSTTNEVNTSAFEIERSANGKDFSSIAFVVAKGSLANNNYTLVDEKAIAGTNYYRLKMVDKDGSYKYSQIVTVKTKSIGVGVFPNPVKGEFTVQHEAAVKGATVTVVDLAGKQVMRVNVQAGATQTALTAVNMHPGTYMIVYNNDGVSQTKQFVKQ